MADDWDPFADPAQEEAAAAGPASGEPADAEEEVEDVEEEEEDAPEANPEAAAGPRYCIVGSWNDWRPLDMTWDTERQIFCSRAQIGAEGRESFQILVDGRWQQCIHPDCMDACPHVAFNLCGPDDRGHDLNWTIGRHPDDKSEPGAVYEVRLMVLASTGTPLVVDWEKLFAGKPAPKPEPSLSVDKASKSSASRLPAKSEEQRNVGSWVKGSRSALRPAGYQGSASGKEPMPVRTLADGSGILPVMKQPSSQPSAAAAASLEEEEARKRPASEPPPAMLSLEWVEKPPNLQIMDDGWVLMDSELDDSLREEVQKACPGDQGLVLISAGSSSSSSNRLPRVSTFNPVCHLGECGAHGCSLNRALNPAARPGFLDLVVNRIVASPFLTDELVYASLGSGELLYDYMLLEALKALDISVGYVHLVDPLYEPRSCTGLAGARLALAQFTRWFPEAMVYAHSSIEELMVRCKRSKTELHFVTAVDCIELTGRWEEVLQPAMEELLAYEGLCFMLSGAAGHSSAGGTNRVGKGISTDTALGEAWQLDKASGHLQQVEKQLWETRHEVMSAENNIVLDRDLPGF
mmetsp:Transcript_8171/g.14970  ORF Transcript_8171/g.14970 Transcript_8171/m.14970 type:complete len:578 (-) Transcript_8171:57-1790(-)